MELFLAAFVLVAQSEADYSIVVISESESQTAYSATSSPSTSVEKIQFRSKAEMEAYTDQLSQAGVRWEKNVIYRADEITLNEATLVSEDPLIADQWSIKPTLPDSKFIGVDIDSVRANSIVNGGPHIYVYVMDSGIDSNLPDLQGRVVGEFNAFQPGAPANDDNGHGTHVTSIFAARGKNGVGIRGIVPGEIKVINAKFLNQSNEGDSRTALETLKFIQKDMELRLQQDPDAVFIGNFSFGGDQYSRELESAMKRLEAYRFLAVTSAGNHGRNNDEVSYYPCRFALLANLCVAASDQYDYKTSFSGYGSKSVHLLAPGESILGLVPTRVASNGIDRKRGTSQAVPHVVGVAALVWGANPRLEAVDVQKVLMESVDVLPGAETEVIAAGRVNAYRAVLMAQGKDPSPANRNLNSRESTGGGCQMKAQTTRHSGATFFYLLAFISGLWVLSSVFRRAASRNSSEITRAR